MYIRIRLSTSEDEDVSLGDRHFPIEIMYEDSANVSYHCACEGAFLMTLGSAEDMSRIMLTVTKNPSEQPSNSIPKG